MSRGSVEEAPTKGAVEQGLYGMATVYCRFEFCALSRDIRMVGRRWQENIGIFEKIWRLWQSLKTGQGCHRSAK